MLVIGVTGGIACGKSTVAAMFGRLGAEVIDADEIAHREMRPGTAVWKKIVDSFGRDILNEDSSINRAELGKIVFALAKERGKLEDIVHPAVIKTIKREVRKLSTFSAKGGSASGGNFQLSTVIVLDVPLLIEADLTSLVDKLVVVTAWRRIQVKRLMGRGLGKKEAESRIDSQMPLKEKVKLADYVIRNNGSLAEMEKQVKKVWEGILKN